MPEWCSFQAELRSQDEQKATDLLREMLETAAFAASLGECELESEVQAELPRLPVPRERPPRWRLAADRPHRVRLRADLRALRRRRGRERLQRTGLECVNLANGMMEIHTPDEHIAVADLEAMVDVTLALVDAARALPT